MVTYVKALSDLKKDVYKNMFLFMHKQNESIIFVKLTVLLRNFQCKVDLTQKYILVYAEGHFTATFSNLTLTNTTMTCGQALEFIRVT